MLLSMESASYRHFFTLGIKLSHRCPRSSLLGHQITMKIASLLLCFLPVATASYSSYLAAVKDKEGRVRRNLPEDHYVSSSSSSSKGYKPPSSKGKGKGKGKGGVTTTTVAPTTTTTTTTDPKPKCQTIDIIVRKEEIETRMIEGVGTVVEKVTMYDANWMKIGFLSEYAFDIERENGKFTTMGTDLYSFVDGKNGAIYSQIEASFGHHGPFQMITGGTGNYGCASGYGQLHGYEKYVKTTLYLCGELCPYPPHVV